MYVAYINVVVIIVIILLFICCSIYKHRTLCIRPQCMLYTNRGDNKLYINVIIIIIIII